MLLLFSRWGEGCLPGALFFLSVFFFSGLSFVFPHIQQTREKMSIIDLLSTTPRASGCVRICCWPGAKKDDGRARG